MRHEHWSDPLIPDHYAVVHSEGNRRIFVIISEAFGDFVLTKSCSGINCGCLGCAMIAAKIIIDDAEYSVLDEDRQKTIEENIIAYPLSEHGGLFLSGLKHEYKGYKGRINKENLDKIFKEPSGVLIIKNETDGTFTHSYVSPTIDRRIISRGCRATPYCPCVGCRIVDMHYMKSPDHITRAVDISEARTSLDNELILPIFEGEEIISKLLSRDPAIRHEFLPNIFGSPIEKMFYELAFLDLHIFPQHRVGKYTLDFSIPDRKIAIELDGHEYHKTKSQRTHDAKRDRWLFGLGWHVLRFTGTEIYQDLDRCIDEICALVGVERLSKVSS